VSDRIITSGGQRPNHRFIDGQAERLFRGGTLVHLEDAELYASVSRKPSFSTVVGNRYLFAESTGLQTSFFNALRNEERADRSCAPIRQVKVHLVAALCIGMTLDLNATNALFTRQQCSNFFKKVECLG
jgi:hypothetical protein